MELTPGYKQTEVGLIPEDWEVHDFDAFGNVIDGDRGTHYPSADEFSDTGYCLFLNAGNVTNEGFKFVACTFITREKDALLNKGKLKRNDIVLTTRGTVGNFAYYDRAVPYEDIRINSGMAILRNESSLDTAFLYAFLQSHLIHFQIERLSFGSAQPQLTVKGISKFRVVVPPLPEQRAIAKALGDVDALLSALTRLIAKKRDLKQAAMQRLLTGQQRLPGFSGEWEVKRLGELAQIVSGGTPKTSVPAYWQGSIKWCTPTDITGCDGKYLSHTERSISREGLANCSARLLPAGSLLLCSRATIGEIRIAATEICTNQGFKSLICNRGVSNGFLYYMLLTMKSQMIEKAIGSTFLEISKKDTASLEIKLPQSEEQTAIAAVLSDMDAELAALEARLAKTRALKQGMMQELLTGKTRLV